MSRETPVEPGSAADWLRHARSDLALAQVSPPPGVLNEALCFHAQQAAEKAIKSVFVSEGLVFPYTHDIRMLLETLPTSILIPDDVWLAAELTEYAVLTRYPADLGVVTDEELRQAVALAEAVVRWASHHSGEAG